MKVDTCRQILFYMIGVFSESRLLYYSNGRVARVPGDTIGGIYEWHDTHNGPLVRGPGGLFRVVDQPLPTSAVDLVNWSELQGATPSRIGIRTLWTMKHPCSRFADVFDLHVIATNAAGEDVARMPAVGFQAEGSAVSFEARPCRFRTLVSGPFASRP
jgi:hypothetical protein